MFNSAAHNKPSLIRDLLTQLQPRLYEETRVRKELIREVEMGPFKHTVDDGLDLRKVREKRKNISTTNDGLQNISQI